jgi:ATP-dependent helicase HrpB
MIFDTPLPIDAVLGDIAAALAAHNRAVLVAPPGAGKTTRVPLALLDHPKLKQGRILVLEPRRLAARASAERMAATLGEKVGETVGLRTRLDSRISAKTRIEIITEGIFTRMILDDPTLEGMAAILFDEFHERSLDADLGLALALDTQAALRDDLRIMPMSATLDGARVASLLGDAPIIESEGRSFPVETVWLGRDATRRIDEQMTDAIMRALREEIGSILAFLPGQGEIMRAARQLEDKIKTQTVIIAPLYGAMDPAAQRAAIAPAPQGSRKIVLATSIAETSLTIEGVRVVVDSGLARVPRFEPDLGLTRLETVRVSRAAADQRRGRAGRTEPGLCYRLWEHAAEGAFEPFARPEILSADLSGLLLDCAAWGESDPARLAFLDTPPAPALKEARALLHELGALDDDNRLTKTGKTLRALPLPVRLARMVIDAVPRGDALLAAEIAALLSERGLGGDGSDLRHRLDRFRRERGGRADDLRRMARHWVKIAGGTLQETPSDRAGAVVALGFPDRIAKARGAQGTFVMANGRGAMVEPHDGLAREPYLAIAEITGGGASARILAAAPISLETILDEYGSRIVTRDELSFDSQAKAVRARRTMRLGAIVLSENTQRATAHDAAKAILLKGVATLGLSALPLSKATAQWRDRVNFLRRAEGEAWPDLSDAHLMETILDWLGPYADGALALADLKEGIIDQALRATLDWNLQQRLDAEAPTHFDAPSGQRHPIDYDAGDDPVLAIRVQELFGLKDHPSLAGGRVPLLLHLLSPAHRPIQITRDLPGFWKGSWASVKAEMKGRYPKHVWPDDPSVAIATHRAKPRGT